VWVVRSKPGHRRVTAHKGELAMHDRAVVDAELRQLVAPTPDTLAGWFHIVRSRNDAQPSPSSFRERPGGEPSAPIVVRVDDDRVGSKWDAGLANPRDRNRGVDERLRQMRDLVLKDDDRTVYRP